MSSPPAPPSHSISPSHRLNFSRLSARDSDTATVPIAAECFASTAGAPEAGSSPPEAGPSECPEAGPSAAPCAWPWPWSCSWPWPLCALSSGGSFETCTAWRDCSSSAALLSSNARMSRISHKSTSERSVRMMGARALISRIRASTIASSASVTRSTLLSKMRSANAICCCTSNAPPCPEGSSRCSRMCFASTIEMIASRKMSLPSSSSSQKMLAMGPGLAMPVVSTRM
mmetsp:Transcript_64299/g.152371  ORF Transcript_64299/g.152371 Transcript_64299/m.152371 type:complete len:229 (-) Transcript_64299:101-787(-)